MGSPSQRYCQPCVCLAVTVLDTGSRRGNRATYSIAVFRACPARTVGVSRYWTLLSILRQPADPSPGFSQGERGGHCQLAPVIRPVSLHSWSVSGQAPRAMELFLFCDSRTLSDVFLPQRKQQWPSWLHQKLQQPSLIR